MLRVADRCAAIWDEDEKRCGSFIFLCAQLRLSIKLVQIFAVVYACGLLRF